MKINEKMNLVIPVETDGITYYAHSTPLTAEAFDEHFLLISQTFNEIFQRGLNSMTGPRIAAKVMNALAEKQNDQLAATAIMNEIRRTTMVIAPDGPMLLAEAVTKGIIDAEDLDILENALVFFIVVSAIHRPATRRTTMEIAVALWTGQITSLNSTAFAASLRTSTVTESSGAKVAGSSVPS